MYARTLHGPEKQPYLLREFLDEPDTPLTFEWPPGPHSRRTDWFHSILVRDCADMRITERKTTTKTTKKWFLVKFLLRNHNKYDKPSNK